MIKWNQVKTAIEIVLCGGRTRGRRAPPALRVRMKRLIETDRELPTVSSGRDGSGYAFFDEPPPGRGREVTYSEFGGFALLLAVRLMDAGLPQSEAVLFIRRIRAELEQAHGRILRQSPGELIDHRAPGGVDEEVKMGRLVEKFDNMRFLVTPGGEQGGQVSIRQESGGRLRIANVARGAAEVTELLAHQARWSGLPIICIELVNPAHQLAYWLARIEPVKRGRK
jgi:hypothetical protein